jgi:hypothetical protein
LVPTAATAVSVVPVVTPRLVSQAMVVPVVMPVTAVSVPTGTCCRLAVPPAVTAATPVPAVPVARRTSAVTAMVAMLVWPVTVVPAATAGSVPRALTGPAQVRRGHPGLTAARVDSAVTVVWVLPVVLLAVAVVVVRLQASIRLAVTAVPVVTADSVVTAVMVWLARRVPPLVLPARPADPAAMLVMAATEARAARPVWVAAQLWRVQTATVATAGTPELRAMVPAVAPGSRLSWRVRPVLTAAMAVTAEPVVPVARPVWPEV